VDPWTERPTCTRGRALQREAAVRVSRPCAAVAARGRSSGSYPDSKLFVTTLTAAIARLWPDVLSNAVDPGWVPTRMGGPGAPDDLRLGHLTQEWLATSDDPDARTSGGYWHHQRRIEPHPAIRDRRFQDELLDALGRLTATRLA
jgi:NAD(P)-dependent dehydrogenase (short-subunit alcohol dehydrogenase family)